MLNNFLLLGLTLQVSICRCQPQTLGLIQHDTGICDEGYILFAPSNSTSTYLIDKCGNEVHTWLGKYKPGQSVYLLPDGTLLKSGIIDPTNPSFSGNGGGIIEKINWDGKVTWGAVIADSTRIQHHDIKALPNGNILIIAWEKKSRAEAIACGRNQQLLGKEIWSEQLIELQPLENNNFKIVWEWHLWDHLVQDFDSDKPNYGNISIHPELVNINYNATLLGDWIHINSVDYNETLDQIMVSSHKLNEVWIIDHSTTSGQAASHRGGKQGKGGDLLYRWGNPAAYSQGGPADQKLFSQHNARWIEKGLPYQNQLLVFNNGNGRPEGNYSTVEIISLPLNANGQYENVITNGKINPIWQYKSPDPDFFAANASGAQMLENGNMLICFGPTGTFMEVDNKKNIVWEYVNPVSFNGIARQGIKPEQNQVFRATLFTKFYPGLQGHGLAPGAPIEK
jgi:hypothetical protein